MTVAVYGPPGALLVAYAGELPAGCVGIAPCSPESTAGHGMTRLLLEVLPARTAVIGFYRRLGYTETEPFATESSVPMIYMERAITSDDILATQRL